MNHCAGSNTGNVTRALALVLTVVMGGGVVHRDERQLPTDVLPDGGLPSAPDSRGSNRDLRYNRTHHTTLQRL
jgi:hypothetical protein